MSNRVKAIFLSSQKSLVHIHIIFEGNQSRVLTTIVFFAPNFYFYC